MYHASRVTFVVYFLFRFSISHALAAPADPATIRTQVSLVTIPVHVTTERGDSVTNLASDDFQLFEDREKQKIIFLTKQDAPLSIGFLLDTSRSMRTRISIAAKAAEAFCKTANPQDEFFLIHFGERAKLDIPFTNDPVQIFSQVARAKALGRTALLDAIHLALGQMKKAHNARKAIVILSDGGDNRSRHTSGQIRIAMSESDVQLYAMGIFDTVAVKEKQTPEEQNGPALLSELAEMTGGRHYPVANIGDLPAISQRIGLELRNEYLLGYVSTNPSLDGKYRSVKVTLKPSLNQPGSLRAQYRRGYYAPVE